MSEPEALPRVAELMARVTGLETTVEEDEGSVTVPVPDGVRALTEVAAEIRAEGLEVADIGLRRPTLDEAFLHLTTSTTTTRSPS